MWHLWTWFTGGHGGVGLIVGLNDLRGLLQPEWFCSCHVYNVVGAPGNWL